ncbi:MAG TPA: GH25 family lysozyme [Anaerolineales bacterium]|nr:GH25 family lysozyme [Anaerolineales bacterium]
MTPVFGIDVSGWVAPPDWNAVSNQGVKFVFVKASENTFPDSKFSQHWQGSKSVGMLRGAYHFFHPETNNSAQQANAFIQSVGADKGELPPVLDLEQVYVNGNPISLPTGNAMLTVIKQWLDPVEAAFGRKPMIYASAYFLNQHAVNASWLINYPLWVAQYPYVPGTNSEYNNPQTMPTPTSGLPQQPASFLPWTFWQYSSKGQLAAFPPSQLVDFNYFNGSINDLTAFASGTAPATTPSPAPQPAPPPPAAPPATPPAPAPSTRTYTVKPGDTLYAIAVRYGTTVQAIAAANDLINPNLIQVGQVLIIP